MRRLVVTADDFGLSEKINLGIEKAAKDGIVTAASLLINAPSTDHAIAISKNNPDLQVGLHLGIVEGYLLTKNQSLQSRTSYFGDGSPCLPRDWKEYFLSHGFWNNKILWREEFEAQIEKFLGFYPEIPFLNSTQHLHLMPGLAGIVSALCRKHRIPWIRVGKRLLHPDSLSKRPLHSFGIRFLSKLNFSQGIHSPDSLLGTDQAGKLNVETVSQLMRKIPEGLSELIVHPGFTDDSLRKQIPGTYQNFDWEEELNALISPKVKEVILNEGIRLVNFCASPIFPLK